VIEVNRLFLGLIAYVVLGVLSWTTLSDQRFRVVTLAILAMFAVKTWARRKEFMHPDKGSESSNEPM
jgi:membrane protein implicated in regulation of membrane protease activity